MLIVIRVFLAISVVLYAAAAVSYIRAFSSKGPDSRGRRGRLIAVRLGVLIQFIGLAATVFYLHQAPFMGIYQGFGFSAWLLAMMYLHITHVLENDTSVGMVLMPLVSLFAIPGLFAELARVSDPLLSSSPWFILHVCIALYSYAAFTVAFAAAVLYLALHREIKSKRLGNIFQRLPSLDQLDHLIYTSVAAGFVALAVSMITGIVWTVLRLGTLLQMDIKEVITIANWIFYAFYLHSRHSGRWRGRRAAWLAIIGFLFLMFNFLVITQLSGTHSYIQ